MPRYDERQLSDVDRRKGRHGCGGHDELAMRQRSLRLAGASGAQGSCARGCRGEGLSKGGTRVRSETQRRRRKKIISLEAKRRGKQARCRIHCVQCRCMRVYPDAHTRPFMPCHVKPCQAMQARATLRPQRHVIARYHRITGHMTRHIPLSTLIRFFIYFYHLVPNHAQRR